MVVLPAWPPPGFAAEVQSTSALIRFALSRHGVFTLAEALEQGVSKAVLTRLVGNGEVIRCHAGLYRYAVVPVTPLQRIYAAVRAAESPKRRAFASHSSAGVLLGLPGVAAGRPEITVTGTSLPLLGGVRVHRILEVAGSDVITVSRVPTSVGSRAVSECAGQMDVRRRIELVDAAICQRVTTRVALHSRALREKGMPGRSTIVAITKPDAEGTFWSALERAFERKVRQWGLPQPRYNVAYVVRGRTRIIDAVFDAGVGVELLGLSFHSTPRQIQDDAERLNLLTEVGLRPLVFTWAQVLYDFAEVASRISAAIAQRRGH